MKRVLTHLFKAEVMELGTFEETGAPGVVLHYASPPEDPGSHLTAKIELPVSALRLIGKYLYDKVGIAIVAPADNFSEAIDDEFKKADLDKKLRTTVKQVEVALSEIQKLANDLATQDTGLEIMLSLNRIMRKIEAAGHEEESS